MEFNIINENNEFKLGNILTVFMLPKDKKRIALFTVSDFDMNDNSLNIAYVNTDNEGYDYLEEITDEEVYKEAMAVAEDIIKNIN